MMAIWMLFMFVLLADVKLAQTSDTLQARLNTLEREFVTMKLELQTTKADLENTKTELRHSQTKLQETQMEMSAMSRRRRVADVQETAFSAQMNNTIEHLNLHQTVIFESVILNEGRSYDNLTGVFTCPVEGVYYFSVSLLSWENEDIETLLVVNGRRLAGTYAAGQRHNLGTSSVVARLKVGDKVWVTVVPSPNNPDNIRIIGAGWTSFTGFKI
ncbi:complement C1q tumor necrosis factor-related protein 2-like [Pecten maximus]|uniref:complement C1q tumor necrosis factor-related protein 2-like n=1 Tax=Pecten maximus TaxID=6579 RepID=UPI001458BB26|nr:complement C1q tumor necrosis factor-related protein 2-like [Pecten maximus]